MNPRSPSALVDKAGFVEHFEVMADCRLRAIEHIDEVTSARFALWLVGDEAQQPEPYRIRQGAEPIGKLLGIGPR